MDPAQFKNLVEHLYMHKFHVEKRLEELNAIENFPSELEDKLHDADILNARARLAFVEETIDIALGL